MYHMQFLPSSTVSEETVFKSCFQISHHQQIILILHFSHCVLLKTRDLPRLRQASSTLICWLFSYWDKHPSIYTAAAKSLQSCPTPYDPIRQQPTRLPRPGNSPGKNTGVGCHFLLQCMKVKSESEVAQSYPTLSNPWTEAYQAPLSTGFSRQEYWSGVPLPSPSLNIYSTIYVLLG